MVPVGKVADVDGEELKWIGGSTVRFCVYDYDSSDEDNDSLNTRVPFQVAYAVSIHKAQGLEAACTRALAMRSYRSVESILRHGLDKQPMQLPLPLTHPDHDNVRGPGYYK